MKSLLLIIVLCRALSWAWPVLPSAEQATEKESQFVEEEHSNTLNEMRRCRYGLSKYTLNTDFARWENRVVTYRILKYTKKLPRADVDEIIKNAFEVWSNNTCLVFAQSWNASDIEILFAAGIHGVYEDDCPFDEESGVLAHAASSSVGGNKGLLHFDEDEKWSKDSRGTNLCNIAMHEIGHVLGLGHSPYKEAVMYETYEDPNAACRLHQDDIEGIQALHGKPGNCSHRPRYPATAPAPAPATEQESPRLCEQNITFDAVTTFQGSLLFFEGYNALRFDIVDSDYEQAKIGGFWPILRCGIEAAYEVEGTLYVFYVRRYRTVSGDLRNLSSSQFFFTLGLPKTISNIDAAVHDQETKKTLFFTGDVYWRYDEETRSTDEGYPRKIAADFPEIGSKVDAAFQYEGRLYLLRGTDQYMFDRRTYRFIGIKKTYTWIDCQEYHSRSSKESGL